MTRRAEIIAVILVILVASFFRLYRFQDFPPGLYPDEAMNGNNALETLATGHWKVFYPENNGREGMFINIQALSVAAFGNYPWALHLPSAIFGILTVLGVYFLGKELLGKQAGILAALFMAAGFWHINFSRIGFRAIMAPLLAVWGTYFLFRAFNRHRYILISIIGGLVFGLGAHTYIAYRAMPLLALIIAVVYFINGLPETRKKILISFVLFTISAVIAFAPLGMYFLKNPQDFFGRTTQVSVFSSPTPLKDLGLNILKTAGMFNVQGDYNWRHNLSGKPLLVVPVGIAFLVGLFLMVRGVWREKTKAIPEITLLSWLIIGGLPVVVSNEGIPHALRAILMAPAVYLIAGFGMMEIFSFFSRRTSRQIAVTILSAVIAFTIAQTYNDYFRVWGPNPETAGAFNHQDIEIARTLNNLLISQPKYIVVEANGVLVRGIPMPTQTIMFLTDTFTPDKQKKKNLYYILPSEKDAIPPGSYVITIH